MRQPGFSVILAALMALAWVGVAAAGIEGEVFRQAGMIPARLAGADVAGSSMIFAWLTPLTSSFVHAGPLHLIFNALMLIYCGQKVEPAIGARWLTVLLLAGAYGSGLAEMLWSPETILPIVGASGATSALIAMYAMLFSEQPVAARGPIPAYVVRALWLMAAWTGLQMLIAVAFAGQVAAIGHIGGFAAGLLLSRPILNRRFARRQS